METQHVIQNQACLGSYLWHGLHVSTKHIPEHESHLLTTIICRASVAVVIRLPYLMQFKNSDFLWGANFVALWSEIEQGLGIIAGNLATLRPLFRQIFGSSSVTKPSDNSKAQKSVMRRAKQWSGGMNSEDKKARPSSTSFNPFKRREKSILPIKEEPYVMGKLKPIRLSDEPAEDGFSHMSEKTLRQWEAQPGRISDEENRMGTITRQSEIHQTVEKV